MPWAWTEPPRVIGHRGAPTEAVENTLASFRACLAAGVPAVELDVRLSADGEVVVHHDGELGRVIRGEGAIESSAGDALRALGVPTLAEVLALPLDAVDVEIKADAANAAELPARVLDVVRRGDAMDRVLVTSFDHELADAFARLAGRAAGMILPYAPEADELASFPRLTHVALAVDAAIPEALEVIAKAERQALVWTVNDAATARALGVPVITDRPRLLAGRWAGASAP